MEARTLASGRNARKQAPAETRLRHGRFGCRVAAPKACFYRSEPEAGRERRRQEAHRSHRARSNPHDDGAAAAARRGRALHGAWRSERRGVGIPPGVIGASVLRPTLPGTTIVGPALTVRNILQRTNPLDGARTHANKMAEFEAHNLATPGDVLVIQGVANVSNMGGISAQTGKRQGERGAIVMGGVRDIAHSRAVGYPVWSTDITPATGKWRIETVEINGEVQLADIRVAPGDLVVADDTGVCFIPRDYILEVLEVAEKKSQAEDARCKAIDGGIPVPDISRASFGEKS
jgi:regulator of RNase E activity RraA